MATTAPRFVKNGSDWFISLPQDDFQEGRELAITKRDGTTANVRIDDWMEEEGDNYLCAFTNLDPKPERTTRAPRRTRTTRSKAKECPVCGETEMFNGIHCDECGY